jgi:hypothetical protein
MAKKEISQLGSSFLSPRFSILSYVNSLQAVSQLIAINTPFINEYIAIQMNLIVELMPEG